MPKASWQEKEDALVREASDPTTPAARLQDLFQPRAPRQRVREEPVPATAVETALAGNPNTPPAVLCSLLQVNALAVARNPALPLTLIGEPGFFHDAPDAALQQLLRSADLPEIAVSMLAMHPAPEVAEAASLHLCTRGEEGDTWWVEVREAVQRLALHFDDALRELADLGVAPRGVLAALGEACPLDDRRRLLAAVGSTPMAAEIAAILVRAASHSTAAGSRPDAALDAGFVDGPVPPGSWARALAARHPSLPPKVLTLLAEHPDWFVRVTLARKSRLAPKLAATLAVDYSPRVRVTLARNRSTPAVLLGQLAEDPNARVRAAVARHPKAGASLLESLSHDPDPAVRIAVRRHPRTPERCRAALLADPTLQPFPDEDAARPGRHLPQPQAPRPPKPPKSGPKPETTTYTYVSNTAPLPADSPVFAPPPAQPPPPTDADGLVRWLQGGPSSREDPPDTPLPKTLRDVLLRPDPDAWQVEARRRVATDQRQTVEVLTILAEHYLATVRARVAGNPATPESVLAALSTRGERLVLQRLAVNPRISTAIQLELVTNDTIGLTNDLLRNPNLAPETLDRIAQAEHGYTREAVLRHRNCSPELLLRLAGDPARRVRRQVAQSARLPLGTTEPMLLAALSEAAQEDDPFCRWVALRHPRLPQDRLEAGAASGEWLDRVAVALNPALPEALRDQLRADGNVLVRAAARRSGA